MALKNKLAEIKTKPTALSALEFIESLPDAEKRQDALALMEMMRLATGHEPVLWSNSIIGFGNKRYRSERTGREVDWLLIGFSPRKSNFSLHLGVDVKKHDRLLSALGKHKTGVGCLYITSLADVDLNTLNQLIAEALKNKL